MLRNELAADDFSAVRALAQHLGISPRAIVDWLQHTGCIPPQVMLSWICLWDLERQ